MMLNTFKFIILLFSIASTANGQNLDIDLLRRINIGSNPKYTETFRVISDADTPVSIGIPAILLTVGLIKKDSLTIQNAISISGSLVISTLINTTLKYSIRRDRPFVTYPEIIKRAGAGSPSFPSGHTSLIFSAATAVTIAYPKWYVATPAFLFAGAVGYSRMYLGVHYPSDVLVGALVGAGSAWLSSFLTRKVQEKKQSKGALL